MELNVHRVAEIRVQADSTIRSDGEPVYWQTFLFLDEDGGELGKAVVYLDRPAVALPVGDQPPYWGIDPNKPLSLVDGKAPF